MYAIVDCVLPFRLGLSGRREEMSSGKAPEYTMLTPLSLTPDVMPHDFDPQLMTLGLPLPCDFVPHYPFVFPPPLGSSPVVLVDSHSSEGPSTPANLTSPEDEADEDDDEDRPDRVDKDPFAPHCKIPLPTPFSPYEYWLEPSFIRRRNERERQRVRNVNEGFERLKSHLPLGGKDKDKRLSKVEILRMAIRYIRNLQDMLKRDGMEDSKENMACDGESDSD